MPGQIRPSLAAAKMRYRQTYTFGAITVLRHVAPLSQRLCIAYWTQAASCDRGVGSSSFSMDFDSSVRPSSSHAFTTNTCSSTALSRLSRFRHPWYEVISAGIFRVQVYELRLILVPVSVSSLSSVHSLLSHTTDNSALRGKTISSGG
jgi:hypothetical protein